MAVARTVWGYIETGDHRLMLRLQHWHAPRWIRVWMVCATRFGDGWFWYALGLCLLRYGGPQRWNAMAAATLAAAAGVAAFRVLKKASHRARPCALEPHCWSAILPPDQFSFPSGHSITAFSVSVAVGLFYSELQTPLLFVAASIAVSRIVLGMHFLSDVIVGSLMGALLGYASFHLCV
jgi:undecaprenyl-diphosphatase